MSLQRVVKPRNQRAKRALEERESKIFENDKATLFIKGGNTSETVTEVLKELYTMKKPDATMLKKKNILRPFEDATSIEFFSDKADSSLFLFGSHNKKRPHNLVIGRLFDHHILDMIELGIENFKSRNDFPSNTQFDDGNKPCLMFAGEAFEQEAEHKRLKNVFIDFFRGPVITSVRLQGLQHVIMFTAAEGTIYLRTYSIEMKKSGSRIPRIELMEMGPSLDLVVRRTHLASDDLYKRSRKQPKQAKPKKKKNMSKDPFGTSFGRIHMGKQEIEKIQIRKMKGLKRKAQSADGEAEASPAKKTSPAKASKEGGPD